MLLLSMSMHCLYIWDCFSQLDSFFSPPTSVLWLLDSLGLALVTDADYLCKSLTDHFVSKAHRS